MYCIIYLFCTRRSYKQFMWIFLVNPYNNLMRYYFPLFIDEGNEVFER